MEIEREVFRSPWSAAITAIARSLRAMSRTRQADGQECRPASGTDARRIIADPAARGQLQPILAGIGEQGVGLALAGFFVVMGPWYLRQLDVFGSLSPSSSSGPSCASSAATALPLSPGTAS